MKSLIIKENHIRSTVRDKDTKPIFVTKKHNLCTQMNGPKNLAKKYKIIKLLVYHMHICPTKSMKLDSGIRDQKLK